MKHDNLESSINKSRWFVAILFGAVIGSYLIWFYVFQQEPLSKNSGDWGTFGDFVGGILNPLVAFSAFYWLTVSVLIQKKELSKTTEALIETSKAQKEQAQTQSRQRFEGTFFQLISLHQEIVKSIDLYNSDKEHSTTGRDCFSVFYKRFKKQFELTTITTIKPHLKKSGFLIGAVPALHTLPQNEVEEAQTKIETINAAYIDFYDKNQSEIGHYFRSLYNIVKFIHNSDIEDKRLYSNLLRAQLSVNEMTLLFYNCLSDLGYEKFKPLIEEYSLLKGIPNKMLINIIEHKKHYDKSAFGNKKHNKAPKSTTSP